MTKTAEIDATILEFVLKEAYRMRVELECWRKRYPHAAIFVIEEAAAKIDDREPNYPPPLVIG